MSKRELSLTNDDVLKELNKRLNQQPTEEEQEEEETPEEVEQEEEPTRHPIKPAVFEDRKKKRRVVAPKAEVLNCPRCDSKKSTLIYTLKPDELFIYKGAEVTSIHRCDDCKKRFVVAKDE